jgi:dethiobiotin synthetase
LSLVVVGTGTEVGKTVACSILLARYGKSLRLAYWKPVATGASEGSDSKFVKRIVGHLAPVLDDRYSFGPPLSPHLAARRHRKAIEPEALLEALVAHGLEDKDRSLIIEGVGGLLVPLTSSGYLLADLLRDFHLPCLLVATSTLGTINHTLLTLEALRSRRLEVAGVVLNGPRNRDNRDAIESFGKADVVAEIPPIRPLSRAGVLRAAKNFDRRGQLKRYLI